MNWRIALLVVCLPLIFVEALYLSQAFDAYILVQTDGTTWWQHLFGQMGKISRWGLTFCALLMVVIYPRLQSYWQYLVCSFSTRNVLIFGTLQLTCYAVLVFLTSTLFSSETVNTKPGYWYVFWLASALACGIYWTMIFVTPKAVATLLSREKWGIAIAASTATLITLLAYWSSTLWGPLAEYTFYLSAISLAILGTGEISISPEERVIGLNDFWINIAPVCSGYEGMGLVCAFVAIYLFINRQTIRLPQSILLFPIGIISIWLLNIVRIVILMIIGAHWSPEVAIGGFHSFGGWIAFLIVSLLILKLASTSAWFNHKPYNLDAEKVPMNTETAVLIPFVILLITIILTSALSADFDWLYPARVVCVGSAIVILRRFFYLIDYRPNTEATIAGLGVAVVWYFLVPDNTAYDAAFAGHLNEMEPYIAAIWLAFRIIGACITVPIAEELAFRGYLLAKIARQPIKLESNLEFNSIALISSSVAFGFLHGHWIAGIAAGTAYGLIRYRSQHIGSAVWAHMVTNFSLFCIAVISGRWNLI